MAKQLIESLSREKVSLEEAKTNNPNIIGIFKGRFVVPGGTSRNGQYYSESHWPEVFARDEVQGKLQTLGMLGTVGHWEVIGDDLVREGKSAISTYKLNDDGYGEAYLLNTAVGREVKTLAGAGTQFYVSSKGYGEVEERQDGVKEVLTDSFALERFDLVLEPGFLEAQVNLNNSVVKEAYQRLNEALYSDNLSRKNIIEKDNNIKGDDNEMDKDKATKVTGVKVEETNEDTNTKVLESVISEKLQLQSKLDETLDELTQLKSLVEELQEKEKTFEKTLEENRKLASEELEKIKEELDTKDRTSTIEKAGMERMISKVSEAAGVEGLIKVLEFFKRQGKIEDIEGSIKENIEFFSKVKDKQNDRVVESLVTDIKLSKSMAKRLVSQLGVKGAIEAAKEIKESMKTVKPARKEINESKKDKVAEDHDKAVVGIMYGKDGDSLNESAEHKRIINEARSLGVRSIEVSN